MNPHTSPNHTPEGDGKPAVRPAIAAVTQVVSATEFVSDLNVPARAGFADFFRELRFRDGGEIDVPDLARNRIIAFLSKTTQVDEYYLIDRAARDLAPGQYRIRQESSSRPIVTQKRHGLDDNAPSETEDNVHPHDDTIDFLRKHGKLLAVIEKDRTTYKSRIIPNCLLHQDEVRGLGKFLDVKADSIETRNAFVSQIGLDGHVPLTQSYREMRTEQGIDPRQLQVWKFHERFKGYIMGVVSGTLTPLGFITAGVASHQLRSALLLSLFSVGFSDGFSDSVANSQATQSGSRTSRMEQLRTFGQTMAGKIAVPMTFVPIAMLAPTDNVVLAVSLGWGALLLAGTAAVQAIANERSVPRAVAAILTWGTLATTVGTILGKAIPYLFGQ